MTPEDSPLFEPVGITPEGAEVFRATAHTASAWDTSMQHGGPVCGLLARALERCAPRTDASFARVTVEILGAVPVAEVRVQARVERPGRRVELVSATMLASRPDGTQVEVARASGWRLRQQPSDDVVHHAEAPLAPAPAPDAEGLGSSLLPSGWRVGFVNAVDWHLAELPDPSGGPTGGWLRLRHPVVAGEETSDFVRTLTLVDVANGIGARVDARAWTYLNTEVTVHLHEPPRGVWVGLRAETSTGSLGHGTSAGSIHDSRGPLGRIAQAVLLERRETPVSADLGVMGVRRG